MPKLLPQQRVHVYRSNFDYLQYRGQVHVVTHVIVAQAGPSFPHESLRGVQESGAQPETRSNLAAAV